MNISMLMTHAQYVKGDKHRLQAKYYNKFKT